MHSLPTNKIFAVGNASVVLNHLMIDNVFISNPSVDEPVINLNDLPGQKIEVGRIESGGMPLLPITTNHVNVLDMYGQSLDFINGDVSYFTAGTTALSAGVSTEIAKGWYAKCAGVAAAYVMPSGADKEKLRLSRNTAAVGGIPAGSATSIFYEYANPQKVLNSDFTVQLFAVANQTITATIVVAAWKSSGTRVQLATKSVQLSGAWKELSIGAFGTPSAVSDADVITIELSFTPASAGSVTVTGIRGYRGSCGLCLSPADISKTRNQIEASISTYIVP